MEKRSYIRRRDGHRVGKKSTSEHLERLAKKVVSDQPGPYVISCVKKSFPGGEIDCVDKDGNTPLHVAARYGHELLINTLITSGADTAK